MEDAAWAVWVWNSNGRRVRPRDVARNNPLAGRLLFATRLPAAVAATHHEVLEGILEARKRVHAEVPDGWRNAIDGWDLPTPVRSLWLNDVVVIVDPTGRGHIYRLRGPEDQPSSWTCRRVRRSLPDSSLLPSSFVGSWVYGKLISGELRFDVP